MTSRYELPVDHKGLTAIGLCLTEGENCGQPVSRSSLNKGAEALATWLLGNADSKSVLGGHGPLRMGSAIRRLLCGAIGPSEILADAIADMTAGAVLPDMWGMALPVDEPSEEYPRASGTAREAPGVSVSADTTRIEGHARTQKAHAAVLGETPPGPLFGCVPPTRTCPYYEVHGLGLAFRLDPAGAGSLHAALADALARSGGLPVLEAAE